MSKFKFHGVLSRGIDAARDEAELLGCELTVARTGGKHVVVELRAPSGECRRFPISGSPRSGQNAVMCRQSVRRAAKSMNVGCD